MLGLGIFFPKFVYYSFLKPFGYPVGQSDIYWNFMGFCSMILFFVSLFYLAYWTSKTKNWKKDKRIALSLVSLVPFLLIFTQAYTHFISLVAVIAMMLFGLFISILSLYMLFKEKKI